MDVKGQLLPHNTRGPELILTPGAICVEFARSPYDPMGFLRVLQFSLHPKNMQVSKLRGLCKLPLVFREWMQMYRWMLDDGHGLKQPVFNLNLSINFNKSHVIHRGGHRVKPRVRQPNLEGT